MIRQNKIFLALITLIAVISSSQVFAATTLTPVGEWRQIDENTKQLHSIIQIYQDGDKLAGKILETFPINNIPPRQYCDLCKGKLHNAPIVGLEIMKNFTPTAPNVWSGGTILDPSSGQVYSCKLTLSDDGKYLKVRGFIGISLLGRNQTWIRKME